jgi:hypothetical protein
MNMRTEFRGRTLMAFRTGAIVVAVVVGFYALFVGSPLELGVALASCGGCWVAADFMEWAAERERSAGKWPVAGALLNSGYGSSYPHHVGVDEYFSRPLSPHPTRLRAPRRRDLSRRMWAGSAQGHSIAGC